METEEENKIAKEWNDHCKRNADLWMEEIAQAHRLAKMFVQQPASDCLHVGEVSKDFTAKVEFFLPQGWVVMNTDKERGWNNYLQLTIKK
jgi:hypothetical protein